jgi:hypothetical protein
MEVGEGVERGRFGLSLSRPRLLEGDDDDDDDEEEEDEDRGKKTCE